jgi:hypothetical protein
MKRLLTLATLVLVCGTLCPMTALAGDGASPINLSLFNPIQITKETTSVTAFRFSLIYGRNADVAWVDLGLVNRATGSGKGLSWNGVGMIDGDFTGWQTGLAAVTKGHFTGFQSAWLYNRAGSGSGFMWGLYNSSSDFKGFQLGLVNICDRMEGLQIGLVNIIKSKEKLKFFPIVNWSF